MPMADGPPARGMAALSHNYRTQERRPPWGRPPRLPRCFAERLPIGPNARLLAEARLLAGQAFLVIGRIGRLARAHGQAGRADAVDDVRRGFRGAGRGFGALDRHRAAVIERLHTLLPSLEMDLVQVALMHVGRDED